MIYMSIYINKARSIGDFNRKPVKQCNCHQPKINQEVVQHLARMTLVELLFEDDGYM
jgi:hypothetical protein